MALMLGDGCAGKLCCRVLQIVMEITTRCVIRVTPSCDVEPRTVRTKLKN